MHTELNGLREGPLTEGPLTEGPLTMARVPGAWLARTLRHHHEAVGMLDALADRLWAARDAVGSTHAAILADQCWLDGVFALPAQTLRCRDCGAALYAIEDAMVRRVVGSDAEAGDRARAIVREVVCTFGRCCPGPHARFDATDDELPVAWFCAGSDGSDDTAERVA